MGPLTRLIFGDKYHGAEDRDQVQGFIVEPLIKITVDASNVKVIAC